MGKLRSTAVATILRKRFSRQSGAKRAYRQIFDWIRCQFSFRSRVSRGCLALSRPLSGELRSNHGSSEIYRACGSKVSLKATRQSVWGAAARC